MLCRQHRDVCVSSPLFFRLVHGQSVSKVSQNVAIMTKLETNSNGFKLDHRSFQIWQMCVPYVSTPTPHHVFFSVRHQQSATK